MLLYIQCKVVAVNDSPQTKPSFLWNTHKKYRKKHKLDDVGILSNLIGSLSLTSYGQCPPSVRWIIYGRCKLAFCSSERENLGNANVLSPSLYMLIHV